MKNPKLSLWAVLTTAFVLITAVFFIVRSSGHVLPTVTVLPETESSSGPLEDHESAIAPEPVNINTADAETLTTLPGIGAKTAQGIIDYRTAHGSFASVQELLYIKGIGEKKLESILNLVTVGGES